MRVKFETWLLLINKRLLEVSDISVYDIEDTYPFEMWYAEEAEPDEVVDFVLFDMEPFKDDSQL